MQHVIDRLYNFHWIKEGQAARSSQAFFGGLTGLMRRHGLKAIINLRGENADLSWWRYERRVCKNLGASHIDAQLSSRHLPTRAMLLRLTEAFATAPRPFLMKCSGGHDRTALAAALFLVHDDGWQSDAEKQFDEYLFGHKPKKHQHWLKPFIAFAREASGGKSLAQWIGEDYAPEDLAQWLSAHGLNHGHAGIFEKPVRSPFQL